MKKAGILLIAFVMLASLLTACGCSSNVTTEESTTTSNSSTHTTASTSSTTRSTAGTTTTQTPETGNSTGTTDSTDTTGEGRHDPGLRRRERIMPTR